MVRLAALAAINAAGGRAGDDAVRGETPEAEEARIIQSYERALQLQAARREARRAGSPLCLTAKLYYPITTLPLPPQHRMPLIWITSRYHPLKSDALSVWQPCDHLRSLGRNIDKASCWHKL